MKLKKLYDPVNGPMNIAAFVSDDGFNAKNLIEAELLLKKHSKESKSPFHVAVLCTYDDANNNSVALSVKSLGKEYDLPVIIGDKKFFYRTNVNLCGVDSKLLHECDEKFIDSVKPYNISLAAYSNLSGCASTTLEEAFIGVNLYPATLASIRTPASRKSKKYFLTYALIEKEQYLHSITQLVSNSYNAEKILMISAPVKTFFEPLDGTIGSLDKAFRLNDSRLRTYADSKIFPKTILDISQGKYSLDENKNLYYTNYPIPNGISLDPELDFK